MMEKNRNLFPNTVPSGREDAWSRLTGQGQWDLLVIGGGITGAGIVREAVRRGLTAALVEQHDFASGTSSRSSNLVHGGLRYLEKGQVRLTRALVRERERLISEALGLVNPMGFLYSNYQGVWPPRLPLAALLAAYDVLAGQWKHQYLPRQDYLMLAPHIRRNGLKGGTRFMDATTDDARLVFRIIREAQRERALAMNYVKVEDLLQQGGRISGVAVRDVLTDRTAEVKAKMVVNATGPWVDGFRKRKGREKHIRPLRGSHLLFPFWRLPVAQVVALAHPEDGRYVFAIPWQGATLVGNTDLDHKENLNIEVSITPEEVDYLLTFLKYQFPSLGIGKDDILSTWSGVRPVIGTGIANPSKEKRDHAIWLEKGLLSVSGGKLTTFRLIALDVLRRISPFFPGLDVRDTREPVFRNAPNEVFNEKDLDVSSRLRLAGRYGEEAMDVLQGAKPSEWMRVPGTSTLWAEVRYAARKEQVVHLEDLLLRRTRLGVVLKQGATAWFDRIKTICQEELGWDEARWNQEAESYKALWERCHSVP